MSEPQEQEQEDLSADGEAPVVFEFEGEEIANFSAQIPSTKLEAPNPYPRGTILDLRLQVRVRSFKIDEDRHGTLSRNHILVIEECDIVGVMTPAQRSALLAQLQAQEMADAAAADAEPLPEAAPEEAPMVDPDDPEDWASLSEEERNALRRRAVEAGVDEFEAHQPHPVNEPVQAAEGEVDGGLEVGEADQEPGRPRELAGVDPGF